MIVFETVSRIITTVWSGRCVPILTQMDSTIWLWPATPECKCGRTDGDFKTNTHGDTGFLVDPKVEFAGFELNECNRRALTDQLS